VNIFVQSVRSALFCAGLLSAAPAAAQDAAGIELSHEAIIELSADHADSDIDTLALVAEYAVALGLGDGWSVQSSLVFEPVEDADTDSAFKGEDGYIESLSLQYAADAYTFRAGKLAPRSGIAVSMAPGLYGAEVGEAYELTEKLGVGFDVDLGQVVGLDSSHVLALTTFVNDRSILSGSLMGKRGRTRIADGGPGNTQSLQSFAVSLDGEGSHGIGYSVNYRQLQQDLGPAEDMATVGLFAATRETVPVMWMAEIGIADNADGIEGGRRLFYTAGATLDIASWWTSIVASGSLENAALGDIDEKRLEVSVGALLSDTLAIEFGLQHTGYTDGEATQLGVKLTLNLS
jgi:hypothetical protein